MGAFFMLLIMGATGYFCYLTLKDLYKEERVEQQERSVEVDERVQETKDRIAEKIKALKAKREESKDLNVDV